MTNNDPSTIVDSIFYDNSNVLRIGHHLGVPCYAGCYVPDDALCTPESRFVVFRKGETEDGIYNIHNVTTFSNIEFIQCRLYRLSRSCDPSTRFLAVFVPPYVKTTTVHAVIINWTPENGLCRVSPEFKIYSGRYPVHIVDAEIKRSDNLYVTVTLIESIKKNFIPVRLLVINDTITHM